MRRFTHRLKANEGSSRPSLRLFVDTEANRDEVSPGVEEQTLWFGWALFEREQESRGKHYKKERWVRFTTAAEFWELIEDCIQPKMLLHIYAHNWDYDAAMVRLQEETEFRNWELESYVRSSHFMWAKFKRDKFKIVFIDTLNYFPVALATLGKSMPLPKMGMPETTASQEDWDAYCKRDVQVIQNAINTLLDVVQTNDLGNFAKTAASQAFNAYKHKYMAVQPLILNAPEISALERSAYYGGRVEVFNRSLLQHPVSYLDINSMYPFVMRENDYPFEKHLKGKAATAEKIAQVLEKYDVVAWVYLDTQTPMYPKRIDDILCFPTGKFWAVLTTPEIKEALRRGDLIQCARWVSYKRAPLFREYVDDLYALRRRYEAEGNTAFATIAKLLLNSLYGKFGQRGRRWLKCPDNFDHTEEEFYFACQGNNRPIVHRWRFGTVLHEVRDEEAFDSMPVISAHVTAHARVYLWSLIEKAGRENVYYCDTDSLFVNAVGLDNLQGAIDTTQIGKLKIEGVSEVAHFLAPKFYSWGEVTHRKGIRANAEEVKPQTFRQVQFESYDRTMGKGLEGQITVRMIQKYVNLRYRKGTVSATGEVTPYVLTESLEDCPADW